MIRSAVRRSRTRRLQGGASLVETLVGAFLLLILMAAVADVYLRSRRQLDYEEDRRKATAVAQDRMDGIRRTFVYDDLPGLDGTDTTFVADGRTFKVSHDIRAEYPDSLATTVTLRVTWNAMVAGQTISRVDTTTTILARSFP